MKKRFGRPALLTIDMQKGFHDSYWGSRNNPQTEEQAARLLTEWRKRQWPVLHIQHLSLQPDSPLYYKNAGGVAFMDAVQPQMQEDVVQKNVNSAFVGTNLEAKLREQSIHTVVIAGFSTPHCVSTTARMSGNLGFDTIVVSDATAAFAITDHHGILQSAECIHEMSLATLHREFATILSTEELLRHI